MGTLYTLLNAGMDYIYAHMIGNGSPGVVGLFTHCTVSGMDYIYGHIIGNGSPVIVGLSTHCAVQVWTTSMPT